MKSRANAFCQIIILAIVVGPFTTLTFGQQTSEELPTPESHFGFRPGDEGMLFDYEELIKYYKTLEALSPFIEMEKVGYSEMGRPLYLLFVSSPENIARLNRLKEINRRLALEPDLSPADREDLVREGRVFVFMTLSIHAAEVAPVQAAPLIVHELVTSAHEPKMSKILENVVYMITPAHNPDGMNMVVDNYNKYKGTRYEGSLMPGVYHKYVGHNLNRDFITLNMIENEIVARIYSTEWFPQVSVDKHWMGSSGPRYYVAPPHDPISENILPGLWNWTRIFGARAITEMTDDGLSGVSTNYLFDGYLPGKVTTGLWKGIIAMLSEAARTNLATSIYIEPNELRVTGKGMAEYEISINMPDPWPGGWWSLSDIVEYERANTFSYLHTAAIHKDEILHHRNEITRQEVKRGESRPPYYYILPIQQHDKGELVDLVNLLNKHGVSTYALVDDQEIGNRKFKSGDIVVPLAQPYRSFIKEVMEAQNFPVRHYTPGGDMIRPYDMTSWSLPLHKGVEAVAVSTRQEIPSSNLVPVSEPFSLKLEAPDSFTGVLLTANNNGSYKAAFRAASSGLKVGRLVSDYEEDNQHFPKGSFFIANNNDLDGVVDGLLVQPHYVSGSFGGEITELRIPRIALVESWFRHDDAGWTRYLFDQYHIPYKVLRPADLHIARLEQDFDLVIIPDERQAVLLEGKIGQPGSYTISTYPPEYTKGMGKGGLNNILTFIDNGGKVISWGQSTDIFMGNLSIEDGQNEKQEFRLPVSNIGRRLSNQGLDVTGSLLRVKLRQDHPLTIGLPEYIGVFHSGNPVFATSIPYFDMDRRVIATFPKDNILMSGFIENEGLLADQVAMVWVKKGRGQIVLLSFCPQFLGSTPATYKLLFNSLLL